MFRKAYNYNSTDEAVTLFRSLPYECQRLFPHVEQLLRLLLVLPVSSASSERSFSSLRRLKTWLRTTMTQQRLNHIAVLHTHQEELDALDTTKILQEFIHALTFVVPFLDINLKYRFTGCTPGSGWMNRAKL